MEEKLGHRPHNGHLPDGQSSSSLLRTPSTTSSTSATSTKAGRVPWLRYVNSALALSSSFSTLITGTIQLSPSLCGGSREGGGDHTNSPRRCPHSYSSLRFGRSSKKYRRWIRTWLALLHKKNLWFENLTQTDFLLSSTDLLSHFTGAQHLCSFCTCRVCNLDQKRCCALNTYI